MSTNPEKTTSALRRLIACANASIANLRQIAEAISPQTTAAAALLDIADLLEGASQDAVLLLTYGPTTGDMMMIEAICRRVESLPQREEVSHVH